MTWARLDDKFPDHKKVVGLSDGAFRLLVVMVCDCANRETDGHIVKADVPRLVRSYKPASLAELIANGNVHDGSEPFVCDDERCAPAEDEVYVHGYLDCNPSHEKLEQDRAATAARKAAWKAKQDEKKNGGKNGGKDGVPNGGKDTAPNPTQTQPNPAQPTGLGLGSDGSTPAADGGVEHRVVDDDIELDPEAVERGRALMERMKASAQAGRSPVTALSEKRPA